MCAYNTENIVALATPPGFGAMAVVRLSGLSLSATYRSFTKKSPLERRAVFSKIYHPLTNKLLDEAVVTFYKSPRSFTGEDVIEISCHGGFVIPSSIIQAAIDSGARMADPGEFSLRGYLNAKMDLIQAEAIATLISSKSQLSADVSLQNIGGRVSKLIANIKNDALNTLSIIENELNFSESEIDLISYKDLNVAVNKIKFSIDSIIAASTFGKDLLTGIRVVIIGRPNSGKSSLFNSIIGCERTIVSSLPGTTRDTIESSFEIRGVPVCLVDTAGIWESKDYLDKLGVNKTKDAINYADICIIVDENNPHDLMNSSFIKNYKGHYICVKSKCDNAPLNNIIDDKKIIYTSAKEGLGIDDLLTHLSTLVDRNVDPSTSIDRILLEKRQRGLLSESLGIINDVLEQINCHAETDIIASGLRGFVELIKDVIGEIPNRDVVNNIFNNFCIGK